MTNEAGRRGDCLLKIGQLFQENAVGKEKKEKG